uniref:Centriolar satellite-associated tubulin polyglutamylase complex regulator 1 n=1 Tax=Electrophorus electricus TaxID=8005 RepID=A0A4W4G9R4_ELEEL
TMNTDRFTLTTDEYLAETDVFFYLHDAVTQLLEHRDEYVRFGVVRYFAEYFASVKDRTHVLFREFGYVKATPRNRAAFIRIFWRCFRQIGKSGDLLTVLEYSSLLQLLCPDFPAELVQNAARIVLMEDAMDCPISFSDFIYSFQIQFYYEEFLESVLVIYDDLLEGKNPNTVIVPTSTLAEPSSGTANEETDTQDGEGVDSSIFLARIGGLCERFKHKHPSVSAVGEILEVRMRVSYYSFLMALAKHEGVNHHIGALPNRSDLLIDPEMDQELERLVAQVTISPTSNSSGSAAGHKDAPKKASPRKPLRQRHRMDLESDGSTEETDSSEN